MDVKERIQMILLLEKINNNKTAATRLGLKDTSQFKQVPGKNRKEVTRTK